MEGFSCTHQAILLDVPHQLWEAITTDGPSRTPLWQTRMFHNKPLFFFLNYARCYFHYLSPQFLSQVLTPYGFLLTMIMLYMIWKKQQRVWKVIRLFIVLYPLMFVFELQRFL